jgi:hypothetical protein
MMEKKITAFQIRISEELSSDFRRAAETYGLSASGLARLVMERFIEARKTHGNHVIFPPEYKYLLPADEMPNTDESGH